MHFRPTLPALVALMLLQTSTAAPAFEIATSATAEIEVRGECTLGIVCGEVRNDKTSNAVLKVTQDWPKRDKGAYKWISAGTSSDTMMKDADGFFVQSWCTATSGSKKWSSGEWHKINDLQTVTVKIIC
jgi:hypothetical protein